MKRKRKWQVVEINVHGIKCDMPGCGWADMTVRFGDYKSWLNRPCPQCNGNLLTQRDLDLSLKIVKITERLNFWLGWIGWLLPPKPGEALVGHEVHMDGTGSKGATLSPTTGPAHDL